MFSITTELNCYIKCIKGSHLLPLIAVEIFLVLLLFAFYLKTRKSIIRIFSIITTQLFMLSVIGTIISAMQCSRMFTIEIYSAYIVVSTLVIVLLPRAYYRILIKKYDAKPIIDIMDWPQTFVNTLTEKSRVYYYDSAVPRAFASGKIIFLSIGMLEIMNDLELKAILAHEVWHLRHNNQTPLLRQMSIMTFTKNLSEDELESLADIFAGEIVSRGAVESARVKLK